ncbi:nucleolar protein 12 [Aspergillus niger]|uniref:Nucleolar protein 12 n=1 Tax=Aspergillus welwitschiae TaxID=1341132 RepID=A0A3F3PMK2_9EURO|nr:RNA binding protein [Aspergillus welwitschiae]RDH28175.1 RNA binding protein [Aspergillus welwitschiae]GLA00795.1 nucleolar protein 12 [Aspergillus niger]GLA20926.1 nucleolar protein 12 [Aspergillus niger]
MGKSDNSLPLLGAKTSIDPTLAALFETSAGPVKAPSVTIAAPAPQSSKRNADNDEDEDNEDVISEPEDESLPEDEEMQEAPEASSDAGSEKAEVAAEAPSRKRKRTTAEDVEDTYMRRIAKEQKKEDEKRREEKAKRQKTVDGEQEEDAEQSEEEDDDEESSEEDEEKKAVPKHESQTGDAESKELDKSNRTVFLGNVSSEAIKSKSAKKTLLKHLASFLSTLPESTGPHKVESIRFRSTAFASGGGVPKRASFAKQEVLDDTTPCTNAYAVYSTVQAARKAPAALNGTVVLDRHLRVDSVAHPSPIDHKRCVFVGNLDFVDNEVKPDDEQKKKKRAPADVEEGLWRTFNAHTGRSNKDKPKNGNVESVRVVRDSLTRVGKGFAYVQFYDQNCVEEALVLNGKHYPPMLPRKLRVSRAKKVLKKRADGGSQKKTLGVADKTLQGRAGRLFGRAGAAKVKADAQKSISQNSTVFEGHRATEGSHIRVKTKSRGSKGKPNNRSSKRAAAYKAAGGWKKGKTD